MKRCVRWAFEFTGWLSYVTAGTLLLKWQLHVAFCVWTAFVIVLWTTYREGVWLGHLISGLKEEDSNVIAGGRHQVALSPKVRVGETPTQEFRDEDE